MPDPWQPGAARWWDGQQWTPYVAGGPRPPDPAEAMASERGAAVWARRAFVAQGAVQALYTVVSIVVFNDFLDRIRRAFDNGSFENGRFDSGGSHLQLATTPLSALWVLVYAGLIVWTHHAFVVARRLGYPTKHTPGWAIAGWLVPILNLWYPYQIVRDCLPPNHPGRRLVVRWWALYLTASFAAIVPVVVSIITSETVGFAVAVPLLVLIAFEAITAVAMVQAISTDHEQAVSRVRGS